MEENLMKAKDELKRKKKPMGTMMQRPKVGKGKAVKKLEKGKPKK